MDIKINLDLQNLASDLKALSNAENKKVLNEATRAAANVLTKRARSMAPRKTGKLRRNIVTISARSGRGSGAAGVKVRGNSGKGKSANNAYYWRFVEEGTKYARPHPFMRPAFDASVSEMEKAFIDKAVAAIDAALHK